MTEEEIKSQIKDEYDQWYFLAQAIRPEFEAETKLFNYEKKNKKKIGDSTVFNVHSAMMAREYVNKPTSKFIGGYAQNNVITQLNSALDTDFNTAYMENLIYQWKHDKFLRWMGIIIRNGWNWDIKTPTFETIDPRVAILDPNGDYTSWEYGFFWFEKLEYRKNIEKGDYENIDQISKAGTQSEARRLKELENKTWVSSKSIENPIIDLYYHFSTFGEQRAIVCTSNDRQNIVKVILLPKLKNGLVAFDDILAVTYRKPRRNNPYGDRFARYAWDVQILKSLLAELRLEKIKMGMYPMYLANTRYIKNQSDLTVGFNKLIPVTPLEWEPLGNALQPLQKDLNVDHSYSLDDSLDRQLEASTSIGRIAQGSSTERREAATTNKLVQDNTDINLWLSEKIDAIGFEKLVRVWLEWYIANFANGDKKVVFVSNGSVTLQRELRKEDFLPTNLVKIKIETLTEITERKDKDRIAFGQFISLSQAIPWRTETEIKNTYRGYMRSMDMSEEDIELQIGQSSQEIMAYTNLDLLLNWIYLDVKDYYEPDTHLLITKTAPSNPQIEVYRQGLLELKREKARLALETPQQDMTWVKNNMVAQGMSMVWNEALKAT